MNGTDGISSLGKLLGSLKLNEGKPKTDVATSQPAARLNLNLNQDQASVSAAGGLAAQAAGDSDVRLGKVQQLQQAIAAGTYSISAKDVADKMVESLLKN